MRKYVIALLAVALCPSVRVHAHGSRRLVSEQSSETQSTQMTMKFVFGSAETSDDVTENMRDSICAQFLKHSAFELGIPDDETVQCKHNVQGFPVKVCYPLQQHIDISRDFFVVLK